MSDAAPQSIPILSDDFRLYHGHFNRIKRASNLRVERSRVAHRKEDEILRRSKGGLFSKIFWPFLTRALKTLGAKIVLNLRPYRQHILDPKRGNTLPIFLQKIEEKKIELKTLQATTIGTL